MTEFDDNLSLAGRRRRDQIGAMALSAARLRRRLRRVKLAGAGVLLMMLMMFAMWPSGVLRSPRVPQMVENTHKDWRPLPPNRVDSGVHIQWIQTDPGITDRLRVRIDHPAWQFIGDDELLQSLASAGRPSGLASVNGRTFLLPE